jgi:hypothetical protein
MHYYEGNWDNHAVHGLGPIVIPPNIASALPASPVKKNLCRKALTDSGVFLYLWHPRSVGIPSYRSAIHLIAPGMAKAIIHQYLTCRLT